MSSTTNEAGKQRLKERLLRASPEVRELALQKLKLLRWRAILDPQNKPVLMKSGMNQEDDLMTQSESAVELSSEERERRIRSATLELSVFGITESDVRAMVDQWARTRLSVQIAGKAKAP